MKNEAKVVIRSKNCQGHKKKRGKHEGKKKQGACDVCYNYDTEKLK